MILLSSAGFTKNCRVLQEADADAVFEEPAVYWVTRPMKDQKMRLQNWTGKASSTHLADLTLVKRNGERKENLAGRSRARRQSWQSLSHCNTELRKILC